MINNPVSYLFGSLEEKLSSNEISILEQFNKRLADCLSHQKQLYYTKERSPTNYTGLKKVVCAFSSITREKMLLFNSFLRMTMLLHSPACININQAIFHWKALSPRRC